MSSKILKSPLPYLALIIAHVIWGANFVVVKITLEEFPPMTLAFLRFALASLFLAPFFLAKSKKVTRPSFLGVKPTSGGKIKKADLPKLIAVGVFSITLNITFFFEGIKRTSAIDASVLTLIIPVLSVLAGWWFLKEKVYLVNLLGIGLGLLGTLTIIGVPQFITGSFSPQIMIGNILILLASISWVIGTIISKKVLNKYSSLEVTAVGFLVGTVTFFIPAVLEYIQNPIWPEQVTLLGLLGLTFITLLSSISAYYLFGWGLSKSSVAVANLFQYIEPLIAASLAVLILNEEISISFIAGALFIVLSAYLGTLGKELHLKIHKAHRT